MTDASTPVLAAGAVCWRVVDGKPKVLLVHRTQHRDVSLPKGKVDPGETLPETAVREVAEETGISIGLGAPLGQVEYDLPSGRPKIVYYWAAEVDDHALLNARFSPNAEISALEWVGLTKARKHVSYPHDVEILDLFAERFDQGRARTFSLTVVRHGKAVPRDEWTGSDASRPLLLRGTAQAASIALGLAAYRPRTIVTSTALRCVDTIAPLARVAGLVPRETELISQDAFETGESDVGGVVAKRLRKQRSAVLCSHGPVIPSIISELAGQTNTPPTTSFLSSAYLSTGEFSVLHLAIDHPLSGVVAVETHGSTAD